MQDEKKSDPPKPASGPKPLVTQVIEAVIDDAAEIAKAVAIGAVVRASQRAKKTEVCKAAVALVNKAEGLSAKAQTKKAATTKKKTPAEKAPAKKSKTATKKSAAKNAPANATKRVAEKSKATRKPRARG
jgi:hypothetical protein